MQARLDYEITSIKINTFIVLFLQVLLKRNILSGLCLYTLYVACACTPYMYLVRLHSVCSLCLYTTYVG